MHIDWLMPQINGAYERQISLLQENLVAELQAQYAARNPLLAEIPEFWKQTLRNAFRHYLTELDHTIMDDLVQVSLSSTTMLHACSVHMLMWSFVLLCRLF